MGYLALRGNKQLLRANFAAAAARCADSQVGGDMELLGVVLRSFACSCFCDACLSYCKPKALVEDDI